MKPIPFTSIRLVVFVSLAVLVLGAVMLSKTVEVCMGQLLGLSEKNEILKFLGIGFGGILLVWQAVIANKRAKAMEETAKAQAKATEEQAKSNQNTEWGQRQERFKNAIEHLGHASDSVRLGGAYELFHLAQDTPDLRQTVLDILCAHIRRTTGEDKYQEKHKSKPSKEIQSLLYLLFMQPHEVFKGCRINLHESWLNGAKLHSARLRKAFLSEAQLQGAKLFRAQLQGSVLFNAQLQKARLTKTQLQGAFLPYARLQGAHLEKTQLQGATSQNLRDFPGFKEHIRNSIGKDSDLSRVIFDGGLERQDVNSIVKGLSDEEAMVLRATLEPHIDKPASTQLPENSHTVTGTYTEAEAEQWIAEYEAAMSEVPKPEAD